MPPTFVVFCTGTDGQAVFELDFAINLPERPLIMVNYVFQTSADIPDLVQSVFEQFGFPCSKWEVGPQKGFGSGRPRQCYPAHYNGLGEIYVVLPLDPPQPISELKPMDDLLYASPGLWPALWAWAHSSGGQLSLTDTRIAAADEAARRANNPPPKF